MTRHSLAAALLVLLAGAAGLAGWAQAAGVTALLVRGTDFRLGLADGRVLHGADLVGATLELAVGGQAVPLRVRIDAALRDPLDQSSGQPHDPDGEVWLFDLRTPDAAGAWQPLCTADPEGKHLGFPLAEGGDPTRLTLTCTSGAVGKCVRFGYAPWRAAPESGGPAMAAYHASCVNMLRGAYGGGEQAWTRNGTRIDVYDRAGIQQPDSADPLPFEAGWSSDGAVCLAHPRIPENGDLSAIIAAVPRLAGHTGPERCTEAVAKAAGALVFNRSAAP